MIELFQHDPDVFSVQNVYSRDECAGLIQRAESIGFEPASVRTHSGQAMITKIRNNDRVSFSDIELANDMWRRISGLLPELDGEFPTGIDHNLRFYRYVPGQKFKRHRDGAVTNQKGETSKLSYLIYLNNCDGGETIFTDYVETDGNREKIELRIAPEPGLALLFRHERWHEGSPVVTGEKYVLRSDVFYSERSPQ